MAARPSSSRDLVLADTTLFRRTRAEESSTVVKMQRQQIEKLKKDNDRLKDDLALETRQIAKLQDQAETFTRKIEQEKKKVDDLDRKKRKLDSMLREQLERIGANSAQANHYNVQKQIRTLENRLDKALVKYNEAIAHNKALRFQIDNLRKERVRTDSIFQQEIDDLQKKQRAIEDLERERDEAVRARMKALNEMVEIKEKADRDQSSFEQEWVQLGHLVDRDRRMKDSLNTQERQRALKGADPALEEEMKLRTRVTKGAWGIAKDKANIHLAMQKVQEYEEAFAKIQKATGIKDIDDLVQAFVNAEDQNFSLFNYVNDLTNEIERMENSIGDVKEEIKKFKGQAPGPVDAQRKKLVEALETRLTKAETKGSNYFEKYQAANKTVKGLKDGIADLFTRIGCEGASAEVLGSAGVTEANMMQYLGVIEQRTTELLQQLGRLRRKQDQDADPGADLSRLHESSGLPRSARESESRGSAYGSDHDDEEGGSAEEQTDDE